tara:strand:+ start:124 stop:333 length:210 start_codon:yes stop_codon:yes gene_type:complete
MNPDWTATAPDGYTITRTDTYAESIRNTYRMQGERNQKERIMNHLKLLQEYQPDAVWTPKTLLDIIEML